MKSPNNKIQAMIVTTKELVEIAGKDLSTFFQAQGVTLLEISKNKNFGPDSFTLLLEGNESNIKQSLIRLKKFVLLKECGAEFQPIKELPGNIKGYLLDMEDRIKFEKLFKYCTKEYLDHCSINNITPHPEVIESL